MDPEERIKISHKGPSFHEKVQSERKKAFKEMWKQFRHRSPQNPLRFFLELVYLLKIVWGYGTWSDLVLSRAQYYGSKWWDRWLELYALLLVHPISRTIDWKGLSERLVSVEPVEEEILIYDNL